MARDRLIPYLSSLLSAPERKNLLEQILPSLDDPWMRADARKALGAQTLRSVSAD